MRLDDEQQYKKEIEALEKLSNNYPSIYKFKVFLFTLLGYGYILSVVMILVGLIFGLGYVIINKHLPGAFLKLTFPLFVLLFIILRSLWVSFPEPNGVNITKEQAPELLNMIEEIRKKIKSAKIHSVIITDDFNAFVAQTPRFGIFGIFGWTKRYLGIGLPLMMGLSTDQLKAVIAHELGHISHAHGRFGNWVYRMRQTWLNIRDALQESESKGTYIGQFIFELFFNWYAPKYTVYSLALARHNEYQADWVSVEVVGSKLTASALIDLCVKGRYLDDKFWTTLYQKVEYDKNPPKDVYNQLYKAIKDEINKDQFEELLNLELNETSDILDAHPSLSQRIKAMQSEVFMPKKVLQSAAEALMGDSLLQYIRRFNEEWVEDIKESWDERHTLTVESKERLSELTQKREITSLHKDEQWELCYLIEMIEGSDAALPVYFDYIKEYPDFPPANFAAGKILIEQNDKGGVTLLDKAMEQDEEFIIDGCMLIHDFLIHQEDFEEAAKYYEKAEHYGVFLDLVEEERNRVEFKKVYFPHQLTQEQLSGIVNQLHQYPIIREAYLVQKKLELSKDEALYVFGVVLNLPWYTFKKTYAKHIDNLANEIDFEGDTLLIYLNEDNAPLKRILKKVPDSKIYQNKEKGS